MRKWPPSYHDLFGFNGQSVRVRGIISLPVELGDGKHIATRELDFLVVDSNSPYTAILGRPALSAFKMVVSQPHLKAKFMTPTGVGVYRSSQKESRSLYLKALKGNAVCTVETLEVEGKKDTAEPVEDTQEVHVGASIENITRIGASLPTDLKQDLVALLRKNSDIFAWSSLIN